MELFSDRAELKQRDPQQKATDKAALQAIAQAAVNVELFTIPLYMVSMYSIHGMHQITSKGNDFYQGRLWPGRAPSPDPDQDPKPGNARAFNLLFSVFIDEMLHLQLAANIAKALGVTPSFTSPALMNDHYGWTCYGRSETVIPHILDFADTREPDMRVMLGALTEEQNHLFLAIEENDADAAGIIESDKRKKYFPTVPFKNWHATSTEANLPMFGTIGHMYKCLWEYMEIEYTDKTKLFDSVFDAGALERDLFNATSDHHAPEYPNMPTMVSPATDADAARERILGMISAITDQGEGQGVGDWIKERLGLLQYAPVDKHFLPDGKALDIDYPNYTDTGVKQNPSGNTVARRDNGGLDHHDRFAEIGELLRRNEVMTWVQWHADKNKWTANMLTTTGYEKNNHPIPKPEEVAAALNSLKDDDQARVNDHVPNHKIFSWIAAGAIAGITRVLNDFWTTENSAFPYPSMYGSGDRVSIYWAIFGGAPDLAAGIDFKNPKTPLYHACQGLSITSADVDRDKCAPIPVAHSCKGSNTCKAEGGCGFVQLIGGYTNCGGKVLREQLQTMQAPPTPTFYSAPSDNTCAGAGGCAVPISASQMFPPPDAANPKEGGTMALYDVVAEAAENPFGQIEYKVGDLVYDVAWKAYLEVLQQRGVTPLEKPKASLIRVALPPST
ncbi:MAG TPA: ferritin-like domain-containing protein [Thermoanaerobaculia bacterium]